jgi:acyl transferase domain-containing protein
VELDFAAMGDALARRRVALPTYPFQRQRHWLDGRWSADDGCSNACSTSCAGGQQGLRECAIPVRGSAG